MNDIRGVVVTSRGTLLVAEFLYKKIKSISPEYKLLSVLKLSDGPQNIILLNQKTVVTGTRDKKLYILNIYHPDLSVQKQIPLGHAVSDIVYYEGQLIVTAMTEPTSLKKIILKGQEIWSVSLDFFPRSVAYTFVNKKATLIGTDGNKNRLCFLDASNGSLIKCLAVEGKGPESVTVDKYGNVYVSYKKQGKFVYGLIIFGSPGFFCQEKSCTLTQKPWGTMIGQTDCIFCMGITIKFTVSSCSKD